jgi:hypothetical protein
MEAYNYFSDIDKFVSIHPVIYKCAPIEENAYLLYERLKFAGLGISFSYKVVFESRTPHLQVIMFSEIRKGARLKLIFDFRSNNDQTILTETLWFDGYAVIKPFFIPFLAKTHIEMIKNLNTQTRS